MSVYVRGSACMYVGMHVCMYVHVHTYVQYTNGFEKSSKSHSQPLSSMDTRVYLLSYCGDRGSSLCKTVATSEPSPCAHRALPIMTAAYSRHNDDS